MSSELDVPVDSPLNVLISYHYFKGEDIARIRSWGLRIIGDSGAYSVYMLGAQIDLDDFLAWMDKWRAQLYWAASLDVVGDVEASWANWQASRHVGLTLVPTIHYGCDPRIMDRYVENGADLIGLGGMVPFKSEPARLMRWCLAVMRYARDTHPHVRFHGWGVTHRVLVDNLPWWSTDSSGYSAAFRYARLRLFDPDTHQHVHVHLNGRGSAREARLLREHYNADWADLMRSTTSNRRVLVRVAMRAMQLHEQWLQERHHVSPPASLASKHQGPELFYASGYGGDYSDGKGGDLELAGPLLHFAGGQRDRTYLTNAAPEGGPQLANAVGRDTRFERNVGPLLHFAGGVKGPQHDLQNAAPTGPLLHAVDNVKTHFAMGTDTADVSEHYGPQLHAALGFPGAQPIKSLDPDDPQRPREGS